MRPIHVRPAHGFDAGPMVRLLSEIAAQVRTGTPAGGPTDPLTAGDLLGWMQDAAAWHLAEQDGRIIGVQWVEPHPDLPPATCDIATFVPPTPDGMDIGSRLFDRTRRAAKAGGFTHIHVRMRRENEGALIYYQSRGFERLTPRAEPPPPYIRMTYRL